MCGFDHSRISKGESSRGTVEEHYGITSQFALKPAAKLRPLSNNDI
jgi:hypothetical protein